MSQPSPDRESLQALLGRVHERLNEAGSVDSGSRELLSQVMGDIERALRQGGRSEGNAGGSGSGMAAAAQVHTPRLEALAVQFEADHPSLSALLNRLVDLLGKAVLPPAAREARRATADHLAGHLSTSARDPLEAGRRDVRGAAQGARHQRSIRRWPRQVHAGRADLGRRRGQARIPDCQSEQRRLEVKRQ